MNLHRYSGKVTYLVGASLDAPRVICSDGEAMIACWQRMKVNLPSLEIAFFDLCEAPLFGRFWRQQR